MTSAAAKGIEKVGREIANLNERIRFLEQNTSAMKNFIMKDLVLAISVPEQNMRAMKEFIEEAIVQGIWPVGNSGRPVTMNALGSSVAGAEEKTVSKGFESDNSNMEQEENVRAHQFRFLGKIESGDVIVFVGPSATHNFISKELVNALGIPLQRALRRFRVNFGCRPGSEGAEVCKGVVLKTQGIEIVETFFVTDLAIADVVLGNQWLRSLGDTTLYVGMPMSLIFNWQGRTVKLEENPSLSRRNEVGIMSLDWI